MNKRLASLLAMASLVTVAAVAQDLPRPSPKASWTQTVGLTDIAVSYSRPSVRSRTIWNDLVPYGQVWRTGANEATTISFSTDVEINGNKLPAGKYSLHTIPAADEWTVIFNRKADQWGSYEYKQEDDALRVKVKPRANQFTETLSIGIPAIARDSAEVVIAWEKVAVPFTVKVDVLKPAFANIEKALTEAKKDDWRVPYRAADFAFQNDVRAEDAAKWVDQSIAIQETYYNLSLKAKMLAKKGDTKSAIATAEKAVTVGKAAKADTVATEKLLAEWKAKK